MSSTFLPVFRVSSESDETRPMYGELVPVGGGDPIPLLKTTLMVGRRESCDIVLRFPNVSAHHCQLNLDGGYWYVKDLNSRNGLKVDSLRVTEKRLDPGSVISIAKHRYEVHYSPSDLGAVGPPPADDPAVSSIFSQSLLERAGLTHRPDDDDDSSNGESPPPHKRRGHNGRSRDNPWI